MIEVELLDDDKGARDFNPVLLTVKFISIFKLNFILILCCF